VRLEAELKTKTDEVTRLNQAFTQRKQLERQDAVRALCLAIKLYKLLRRYFAVGRVPEGSNSRCSS
jgi:hypothetical protein